jgi:hypothetical protein
MGELMRQEPFPRAGIRPILPSPKYDVPSDRKRQGVDRPGKLGRMTARVDPYAAEVVAHTRLDISAHRFGQRPPTALQRAHRVLRLAAPGSFAARLRFGLQFCFLIFGRHLALQLFLFFLFGLAYRP